MPNESVADHISRIVKSTRLERKMSLQKLADLAGSSKSHIWEIENRKSANPTINMAVNISRALGVSIDYLTGLSSHRCYLHPEAMRIAVEIDAIIRGNINAE